MALLEVTDLKVHFETDDGIVQAVDGVSYTVDRGQALGIVGESGSGKSVSSLTVMGLTRFAGNARISGSIRFDGKDLLSTSDEDMRTAARQRGRDDLPGPAVVAASLLQDRRPAGGGRPGPPRRLQGAGPRSRGGDARAGRHPRAAPARGLLSARVLGRHAPARDDRHGAHQRSQAADRRRADDGARRDRAGADPRPHPAPAARARHGDRDDHPRPRRGGRGGRRHRRDVRGADRRVRRQGHDLRDARAPLHLGAAQVDPAPGLAARRGARAHPGPPAVADQQAAGLLLPPALSVRARGAQAHRPAAGAGRRRGRRRQARGGLPAAGPDAPGAVGGAARRRHARRGADARGRARRGRRPRGGRRGPRAGRHRGGARRRGQPAGPPSEDAAPEGATS